MSGAADLLAALAEGEPAAFAAVLQTCRFEGFGVRAYGGEAIQALFRDRGVTLKKTLGVCAAGFAALVGRDGAGEVALAADLHAGRVTRLWRLGGGEAAGVAAPSTSTPADLDRDQRGGRLAFDPADHRDLDPGHAAQVRALGERWLRAQPARVAGPLARMRPLVLRAASEDARAAALYRLEGATASGLAGFYAVAVWDGAAEPRVALDLAGRHAAAAAPWRPAYDLGPCG